MSPRVLVSGLLLVLAVALGVAVFVPMATGFNPRLSGERVWLLPDPSDRTWAPGDEHAIWLESVGEGTELRVGEPPSAQAPCVTVPATPARCRSWGGGPLTGVGISFGTSPIERETA